jgi:glyoxylase-like metal-dependent hydrolase (beta-lactamase superfamily II)
LALILAAVAAGFLVRDGFARWHTSPYSIAPARYRSWDKVLARRSPIAVETFVTGFIDMNRCDNLDPSNPLVASCTSPGPLQDLAHLVVHPRLGAYLIDSGFAGRFASNPPYGNYSLAMQLFNRALGVRNGQQAHQSVAEILRERHIHPRAVFFTHLHPDHTSAVPDLPEDTEYVFARNESGFLARVAVGSHFDGKPRLETFDYASVAPIPPLGPSIDLLGDGSLWAISTPGHTPDHTSYLVNGDPPTLLVGDAPHFAWAFEHDVAPRAWSSADRPRAVESLRQLRSFADHYPQVRLLFGHEK